MKRGSRGFTLIEALVAFVILGLTLSVVFRTLSTGIVQEHVASAATVRVLEARSILDRLAADIPLQEGVVEGELSSGDAWTLVLTRLDSDEDQGDARLSFSLYKADLQIEGTDGRALRLSVVKMSR